MDCYDTFCNQNNLLSEDVNDTTVKQELEFDDDTNTMQNDYSAIFHNIDANTLPSSTNLLKTYANFNEEALGEFYLNQYCNKNFRTDDVEQNLDYGFENNMRDDVSDDYYNYNNRIMMHKPIVWLNSEWPGVIYNHISVPAGTTMELKFLVTFDDSDILPDTKLSDANTDIGNILDLDPTLISNTLRFSLYRAPSPYDHYFNIGITDEDSQIFGLNSNQQPTIIEVIDDVSKYGIWECPACGFNLKGAVCKYDLTLNDTGAFCYLVNAYKINTQDTKDITLTKMSHSFPMYINVTNNLDSVFKKINLLNNHLTTLEDNLTSQLADISKNLSTCNIDAEVDKSLMLYSDEYDFNVLDNNKEEATNNSEINGIMPTVEPIYRYTIKEIDIPEKIKNEKFLRGYDNGLFLPEEYINLAEVSEMLYEIIYDGRQIFYSQGNESNNLSRNEWYAAAVSYLTQRNIDHIEVISPNELITRAQLSQMLFDILSIYADKDQIIVYGNENINFSDIDKHNSEEAIKQLASNNIITGYSDGTFRPDNNITRAETVVIICKAFNKAKSYITPQRFPDVDTNHWAYEYINSSAIID
jgi:hypothetical protein